MSLTLQDIANCEHLSDAQRALALRTEAKIVIRAVGKYGAKVAHLEAKGYSIPITKAMLRGARKVNATARAQLMQVCRELIDKQIKEFRVEYWKRMASGESETICPLSGEHLLRCGQTDVDHSYPFVRLVEDWLSMLHLTEDDFEIRNSRKLGRHTLGYSLDLSWQRYHQDNAKLQLTSHRANLRKGANVL